MCICKLVDPKKSKDLIFLRFLIEYIFSIYEDNIYFLLDFFRIPRMMPK